MEFRILSPDGASNWMPCKDWDLDAVDALADDCNMIYGNSWQLEYRNK